MELNIMLINSIQLKKILNPQHTNSVENMRITAKLIKELEIQNGSNLAVFLEIDGNYSNHVALRKWVNKKCEELSDYEFTDKFTKLKAELIEIRSYAY